MALFFVNDEQISGTQIVITGGDVHHASRVLRIGPEDKIDVADFGNKRYECTVLTVDKAKIVCRIDSCCEHNTEPTVFVRLFQGLPKGDKMETIIQKCTELGITSIVPVRCSRSIVQLQGAKAQSRVERWQKIADEAAKQCRRSVLPKIEPVCDFEKIFSEYDPADLAIIPWEKESDQGLKQVLQQKMMPLLDMMSNTKSNRLTESLNSDRPTISVLIGPEGGFEEKEVMQAIANGMISVSLGPRILRTETAGMSVLAAILYQSGNLG